MTHLKDFALDGHASVALNLKNDGELDGILFWFSAKEQGNKPT